MTPSFAYLQFNCRMQLRECCCDPWQHVVTSSLSSYMNTIIIYILPICFILAVMNLEQGYSTQSFTILYNDNMYFMSPHQDRSQFSDIFYYFTADRTVYLDPAIQQAGDQGIKMICFGLNFLNLKTQLDQSLLVSLRPAQHQISTHANLNKRIKPAFTIYLKTAANICCVIIIILKAKGI